jgi:hypothetical protein
MGTRDPAQGQEQFCGYFADGLLAMPDGENSNRTA